MNKQQQNQHQHQSSSSQLIYSKPPQSKRIQSISPARNINVSPFISPTKNNQQITIQSTQQNIETTDWQAQCLLYQDRVKQLELKVEQLLLEIDNMCRFIQDKEQDVEKWNSYYELFQSDITQIKLLKTQQEEKTKNFEAWRLQYDKVLRERDHYHHQLVNVVQHLDIANQEIRSLKSKDISIQSSPQVIANNNNELIRLQQIIELKNQDFLQIKQLHWELTQELENYQTQIRLKDQQLKERVVDNSEIDMWKQRLQEKNEELEKVTKKLYLYEKKYQESMLERRDDSQLEQQLSYAQQQLALLQKENNQLKSEFTLIQNKQNDQGFEHQLQMKEYEIDNVKQEKIRLEEEIKRLKQEQQYNMIGMEEQVKQQLKSEMDEKIRGLMREKEQQLRMMVEEIKKYQYQIQNQQQEWKINEQQLKELLQQKERQMEMMQMKFKNYEGELRQRIERSYEEQLWNKNKEMERMMMEFEEKEIYTIEKSSKVEALENEIQRQKQQINQLRLQISNLSYLKAEKDLWYGKYQQELQKITTSGQKIVEYQYYTSN